MDAGWRRLGEKLSQVIAAGPVVFGSDGHGWRARPPISEEEAATYGSLTGG